MEKKRATKENFTSNDVNKLLMKLLIEAAEKKTAITYGAAARIIAERCDIEWNFMFPRNVGIWTMDHLMKLILAQNGDTPLLNVLLVLKVGHLKGYPSSGSKCFIKGRYLEEAKDLKFPGKGASKNEIESWMRICHKAQQEVYDFRIWHIVYENMFGQT